MYDWKQELAKRLAADTSEGSHRDLPCPLTAFEVLDLDGEGARQLLHGQVTCEVRDLQTGEGRSAALCSPKGRVQATLWLLDRGGGFLVCVPPGQSETIETLLGKVAPFFKVAITDASDRYCPTICSRSPANFDGFVSPIDAEYRIAWLRKGDVATLQEPVAGSAAPTPPDPTDWAHAFIQRGWPAVVPQTRDRFLPQDLNLDLSPAVSFSKGCYTGQEIVARLHYRGKPKRRLQRLQLESAIDLSPGDFLRDGDGSATAEVVLATKNESAPLSVLAVAPIELPQAGDLSINGNVVSYHAEALDAPQAAE